ncbi:hypothetical protein DV113_003820 [Geotrichum candidum]|nr:hypothetical protein DV452_003265 [Geotrichum candidum]KAF7498150.1 hypothetical protein DV113_003820 [Geotrichum candidum]KAI8134163.1 hypothetical protein DUD61_002213 [Geotrichum candidum]KAI9212988.1 hypothetical protein DS838_002113 [Geotrichum bryndzae]
MRLSIILRNESSLALSKETPGSVVRTAARLRRRCLWQDPRYLLYIHRHMGQLERSLKRIGPQNQHLDEFNDILEAVSLTSNEGKVKNDLLESGHEIWDRMMHRSRSSVEKTKQYNTRDMGRLQAKVPTLQKYVDQTESLTKSLVLFAQEGLAEEPNWNNFDRFWSSVAWTPLALILAPELLDRVFQQQGPEAAYNLLIRLGHDKFFAGNDASVTDKKSVYFISHRYEMAVTGAVNAFIYNITHSSHLDPNTKTCIHYNLIYDVFDKLNRNISLITLLPKAISRITETLPRKAYADFYAIFLVRKVNLRNSQFRAFLDRMLLTGTDAEKALVMNADRLLEINNGSNGKHPKPLLALKTYKTILAHLGRFPTSYNRKLATFIIDNLLVQFYNENKVAVLEMTLRYSADTGAMEDAARIYQFILQAQIQPTMDVYTSMFRGFRIFAHMWGPQRGFDILKLIHDQNISFPPYFCTEILRFVEQQYHGLIVYNFYLAYFEDTHLEELGLASYFRGLYSEDIEVPAYEPSIAPAHQAEAARHPINPIALSILYAGALNSMTNAHHVAELYNRFKAFLLAHVPTDQPHHQRAQYYFVFDGFVQTLCFKFGTPEAVSMAHGIVEELPQLVPRTDAAVSADAAAADSTNDVAPGAARAPYRYTGRPLRAFEHLLAYHVRQGQLDRAVDTLNAAIAYTPRAGHLALVRPIIKALVRAGDLELATRWFDYSKSALGVVFQPEQQDEPPSGDLDADAASSGSNDFVRAIEAYRAEQQQQATVTTETS